MRGMLFSRMEKVLLMAYSILCVFVFYSVADWCENRERDIEQSYMSYDQSWDLQSIVIIAGQPYSVWLDENCEQNYILLGKDEKGYYFYLDNSAE